ncbi:hypothetical protein BD779DRAFT_1672381 [Infundibulicybe gibba]|nr:hypothetical protein BD779DRAFT_1672381 [Infundibulicybe gibba]
MDELLPQTVLNRTFGAALLGSYAAVVFWGITCLQTAFYYINYRQDKKIFKLLVLWLWYLRHIPLDTSNSLMLLLTRVMDTTHQALIMKGVYTLVVTNFGDLQSLNGVIPELLLQVGFTSLTAAPMHLFFIYRIWKCTVSGERWIFVITLVPATAYHAGLFVKKLIYPTGLLLIGDTSQFMLAWGKFGKSRIEVASGIHRTLATSANLVAAVLDVTIAAGMVCVLLNRKDLAVHDNSKQLLSRLLFFSINTGVWTAAFAVVSAITFIIYRDDLIYIAFYFPLCPMYCNTLLANLNVRGLLRGSTNELHTHEIGLPDSWMRSTQVGNIEFAATHSPARRETLPDGTPTSVG